VGLAPAMATGQTQRPAFVQEMKSRLHKALINRMDLTKLAALSQEQVHAEVSRLAESVLARRPCPFNG